MHPTRAIEPKILYVGTPVALIVSSNDDGSFNLAPMSSAWALGQTLVLGLAQAGQTYSNLLERPELTINFPGPTQWEAVERLAPLTGRNPIPESKHSQFRFEADKFGAALLTPRASLTVSPPRVAECPIQLEATVAKIHQPHADDSWAIVEANTVRVHAHDDVVISGTHHIDPARWQPLLYVFRHYFGTGPELGRSFRAETPQPT